MTKQCLRALPVLAMMALTVAASAVGVQVTVGPTTTFSPDRYMNQVSLAVSGNGAVAAFFQYPSTGIRAYKVSLDGGLNWGQDRVPPPYGLFTMCAALSDGSVVAGNGSSTLVSPGVLQAKRTSFSDGFERYASESTTIYLPGAALAQEYATFYPLFDKGKMVRLPGAGNVLLATMYGCLTGDIKYRTMIVDSTDSGYTWNYRSTVAYSPNDPDPWLVGQFAGFCEPSLALLPDGRLLCIMRVQGSQYAPYKPMYVSWSSDNGYTWSAPILTSPYLYNVWPTLAVLENGVVACVYGRPGVSVAFSTDNGQTWPDKLVLSTLPEPSLTGYADMIKVGPNKLVVLAGLDAGVQAVPITVDYTPPPPPGTLSGTISLNNFSGSLHLAPIKIELIQGSSVVRTELVTLTANPGQYSIPDIPPGNYDVAFSACKWLRVVVPGVTIPEGGSAPGVGAIMVNGDMDGDNEVTASDLSLVLRGHNQAGGP